MLYHKSVQIYYQTLTLSHVAILSYLWYDNLCISNTSRWYSNHGGHLQTCMCNAVAGASEVRGSGKPNMSNSDQQIPIWHCKEIGWTVAPSICATMSGSTVFPIMTWRTIKWFSFLKTKS